MQSGGKPALHDESIWIATVEILVAPDDLSSGRTKGFINITTWASTEQGAAKKVARHLERYNWHLLGVERIHRFEETASEPVAVEIALAAPVVSVSPSEAPAPELRPSISWSTPPTAAPLPSLAEMPQHSAP